MSIRKEKLLEKYTPTIATIHKNIARSEMKRFYDSTTRTALGEKMSQDNIAKIRYHLNEVGKCYSESEKHFAQQTYFGLWVDFYDLSEKPDQADEYFSKLSNSNFKRLKFPGRKFASKVPLYDL